MNYLKLIGEIKDINLEKGQKEIKGKTTNYIIKVKITNTFHSSLPLPKGIARRIFTVKKRWVYPYIPEIGSKIGIDGEEIGMDVGKINLSNKTLSITILPELGGRIVSLQYLNHTPIQSPLLYGTKAELSTAGISENLGEKINLSLWKFDILRKSKRSVTLECKKKGWIIKKSLFLDKNIIYRKFKITEKGIKKELDINFNEILSLIPDIKNLSIHIPTTEKLFVFTPSPVILPWFSTYRYYSIRNGMVAKVNDTVLLWQANMKDIDNITVKERHWLINIASIWSKLSIKKGDSKLFKSRIILGEDFKIDGNGIGVMSEGEWLWVRNE